MKCFEKDNANRKYIKFIRYIMPVIIITLLFITLKEAMNVNAVTGTQVNVTVNFLEETATVLTGPGGSSRFYISTDKKSWENIATGSIVDISGYLSTKEVEIYFKGNKDTNPKPVKLMAEPKDLTAVYTITNGAGLITCTNTSGTAIEYRKGKNGNWNITTNTINTALYELKGTTLYFRTVATPAKRTGKIVTVKISKRPSAPAVKLDGGKLLISGMKAGLIEYQVDDSGWGTFNPQDTKQKTLSLYTLLTGGVTSNSPLRATVIEFRTKGTAKKVYSASRLIEIPAQQPVPETISITGTKLTITDNTKRRYEYTKVEKNAAFNIATAKWSSVSANKPFIIPKIAVGDKVLVRLKSSIDSTTKQVIPASTYKEIIITSITLK